MTNQPDPVIDAVQDRHVESIMLSGSPFVSAILGPGAYRISADLAPLFYTEPVVTGSAYPVSVLTCGEGSFNSSPRASLTYQWKRDTVNIAGETNFTYASVLSDIGTTITCEVTATNASGSDTGLSNGILMLVTVPGYVYEMDINVITGMNNSEQMDVNGADIHIISGMGDDQDITIFSSDVAVITGMSSPPKMDVNEVDCYPIFLLKPLTPLVILNHDAEDSDLSDWNMDTGNVSSVTDAPVNNFSIGRWRQGARFFKGDDLGQGVDSQMSQVMAVAVADETDIDTGLCYAICNFMTHSLSAIDLLIITMEALNAADGVLATAVHTATAHSGSNQTAWWKDNTGDDILSLPTLTRKIKLTVLFQAQATGTPENNIYADDFSIDILKIA